MMSPSRYRPPTEAERKQRYEKMLAAYGREIELQELCVAGAEQRAVRAAKRARYFAERKRAFERATWRPWLPAPPGPPPPN